MHMYMLWFKADLGSFYFLNLRCVLQLTAWLQQREILSNWF